MSEPLRFWFDLDMLDETEATFTLRQPDRPDRLILGRDNWVTLGCPSRLEVPVTEREAP